MSSIPDEYQDLLQDKTRAFAYLATLMRDSTPQVTPVWFSWDGKHILVNSAVGRVKDRNMRARPFVALTITDPKNPYRYLQIRGKVIEITEAGGTEHIHALSQKYHGKPYTLPEGQVRVIYKIKPQHVTR